MRIRIFLTAFIACFACAAGLSGATTMPFQFNDGMIWLKVKVEGRSEPLKFLLDSGAGTSVIDLTVARQLNLVLKNPQTVYTVHGRSVAYRAQGFAARTAGVDVPSSPLALDLSGASRNCHQRIDGLLGSDFFKRRIVQIDYRERVVRLLNRDEVNEAGAEVLRLATRNDAMCAQISVGGGKPEWFRLDTGCNTALEWVVGKKRATQLGLTTIGVNSGPPRETEKDVQLGSKRISGVKTGLHFSPMFPGESGLIGNGLLGRFTVTIDTDKRRCLLVK